ncbi:5-dehydro-4-deoxy-D-glucuronate isomerase [Microvirga sp. 2MCAF38]|uniref:5-dehydro-4-deoxy-D-glucuronate isomerase n=1 Tax=Microvirga sp. 2MCAF38 TaxID=3232989 RepID=UPI003F94A7E9
MDTRQAVHYEHAEALGATDLRRHFVIDRMFAPGSLEATYTHYDRMMVAGVMPTSSSLRFGPEHSASVGANFLLERRELGLINIGGPGRIVADGSAYDIGFQDGLYLSMGTKEIVFESLDQGNPAKFYVNTCPAHAALPSRRIAREEAIANALGDAVTANKRKLYQYLHPKVLPTCQLLMGLTRLETGSVWNTMPAHTHDRRMEAYLYFELPEDAFVVHLMGRPNATRHLIMRNEQAVLSPPWSIHCGAGTGAYAFIWSMAGDNQLFTDMDMVAMRDVL